MALPMCFNSIKEDYHFRGKTSDTILFRGKISDTIAKSNFGFIQKVSNMILVLTVFLSVLRKTTKLNPIRLIDFKPFLTLSHLNSIFI